jgi:hypothetical protein
LFFIEEAPDFEAGPCIPIWSGRGVKTEVRGEGGEENGDGIGIRLY